MLLNFKCRINFTFKQWVYIVEMFIQYQFLMFIQHQFSISVLNKHCIDLITIEIVFNIVATLFNAQILI